MDVMQDHNVDQSLRSGGGFFVGDWMAFPGCLWLIHHIADGVQP
jgi:hypothetical protein